MEYLIKTTNVSETLDCCFFGAKCECQAGNVCAQCSTLCGGNCSTLCIGNACVAARAEPFSSDTNF